jgi:hypothetical protein
MQNSTNIKVLEQLSRSLNSYIRNHEDVTLNDEYSNPVRPDIPSKIIHTTRPLRTTGQKITIMMHTNDHCPPHFHASIDSGTKEATFNIKTSKLIQNRQLAVPKKIITYIETWCSNNMTKTELLKEWNSIFGASKCNS